MEKLYKRNSKNELLYAEYWIDEEENKGIIHYGKVGKEGKDEEYYLGKDFNTKEELIEFFKNKYEPKGYKEIPDEETCYLAVQFPMKSLRGNKRDIWLRDKVTEYLNDELGWKGVGHVDGFDMGQLINFEKKFALTIFCVVVDEEKGIRAIKHCLRYYRLDYERVKIASRPYLSNVGFELKFSAKKKDQTFSI